MSTAAAAYWSGRDPVIADVAVRERRIGWEFIERISKEIRREIWPIGYDPVEMENMRRQAHFEWEARMYYDNALNRIFISSVTP